MVDFWRIQVTSFGQPGRTDCHPEDASGLLVIASCPEVGVGQSGAHDWITPAGLLRALGRRVPTVTPRMWAAFSSSPPARTHALASLARMAKAPLHLKSKRCRSRRDHDAEWRRTMRQVLNASVIIEA